MDMLGLRSGERLGHKPWNGSNDEDHDQRTTQEELDFMLKKKYKVPPEERYQRERKTDSFMIAVPI